ncbi:MAG: amidohydrolase family protein [Candidatus Latescibacterota bacterium]|nr:amidohydrolase family protein [Candidatus Latescibacterota bacterium]
MPEQKTTLIRAARLADGLSTSTKPDQAVLIDAGRIQQVGDATELAHNASPETETIDLGDATLTPGLIDGHTHLSLAGDDRSYVEMFAETDEMMVLTGVHNLRQHLDAGITTLREHGARNKVGFIIKEALSRGYIPGPRMQVSGRPITCTGGHFHMCNEEADGPDEIRRSVRRLVHEGADYLKIMASGGGTLGTIPGRASYSVDELHAAVHEAHHFHKLTAAHCRAKESMQRAVEAGIDLMEHAEFLDPDDQMRFDPDLAEKMAECGIWISPTLQAWTKYGQIAALESKREDGTITPAEENELKTLEDRAEKRLDIMRRMLDYCLIERIVPGTDSGVGNLVFGHLDYDLRLLVKVGFTPGEALLSATRISAEAIGMGEELGTIEPGKIADLAAFRGDPTEDAMACSDVIAVFQEGVRVR